MGVLDSINDTNKKATEVGERFLTKSYEYYKLKTFQQLTISVSMIVKLIAVGCFILLGFTFLTIALAFMISDIADSYVIGFSVVGALFLLISLMVYLLRKHINVIIIKALSKPFFSDDENI